MYQRPDTERVDQPREGWPWFRVIHGGASYALRLRGGPRERAMLAHWVGETRRRAMERFGAVQEQIRALNDTSDAATVERLTADVQEASVDVATSVEATAGYLVGWAWADPSTGLDARRRFDAGEFAGPHDAKAAAGLAVVDELIGDGWEWDDIDAVASAIQRQLLTGNVEKRTVVEVRPFSVAPEVT